MTDQGSTPPTDSTQPTTSLGNYLRQAREAKGISIEQVASSTKINVKLLHALESDSYDKLPAKPFVRGFISSYAKFLGIEPREVVSRFDQFLDSKTQDKATKANELPHIFVDKDSQRDSSKTWLTLVMGVFIVLGIIAAVVVKPLRQKHSRKMKDSPTQQELVTVSPPNAEAQPPVVAATATPIATPTTQPTATPAPSPKATATPVPTPKATPTPAPSPKATPTPAPTAKPAASPAPSPTASAAAASIPYNEVKQLIVVRAIEDSWIKYQSDNFPIKQYTLRTGQKIFIRARESIRFRSFNPKAIEISTNGKDFKKLDDTAKTLVFPQSMEEKFKETPFTE